MAEMVNVKIARLLQETASILEEQGANRYRAQAYRNAAQTLLGLDRPVTEFLEGQGEEGLKELPAVGESIARFIRMRSRPDASRCWSACAERASPSCCWPRCPGSAASSAPVGHRSRGGLWAARHISRYLARTNSSRRAA